MYIPVDISKVYVTSYPHYMVIVLSFDAFYFHHQSLWSVEGANYWIFLFFELDSDKYQFTVVCVVVVVVGLYF